MSVRKMASRVETFGVVMKWGLTLVFELDYSYTTETYLSVVNYG